MIELFGKAEEAILTAEQTVDKCSVYKKIVSFSNAKSQGISKAPLAFWRLMRPPLFTHYPTTAFSAKRHAPCNRAYTVQPTHKTAFRDSFP